MQGQAIDRVLVFSSDGVEASLNSEEKMSSTVTGGTRKDSDASAERTDDLEMPAEALEQIGKALRHSYNEQLNEPVPDRLTNLLRKLGSGGKL